MYANKTGKSNKAVYELSLNAGQQEALTSITRNGDFDAKKSMIASNQQGSFQAKPAYVLSFDNPAHARRAM